MPTSTSNYSLQKPLVNNATDQDLWGDELNDDLDDIDALLYAGITVATQPSQTTGFTATATISVKNLYPCDATSGTFNGTIPDAATSGNGATVFFKKTDASVNAVGLVRTGANTLDGATSLSLTAQNDCYGLVSDGVSAWNSIVKPASIVDASTSIKGIVQLATAAEVLTGSDTSKVSTPAALAGNKSLSGNGYYKFPGGLVEQWGSATGTISGSVIFPTAFSTSCYSVVGSPTTETNFFITAISTSGFSYGFGSGGSRTFYWQAKGV